MDLKYYHYTPEYRLEEIIECGEIKLASTSIYASKEKACAWISTNSHWEHTATKSLRDEFGNFQELTFGQQLEILGCTRIQVKPIGLIHWAKIKHLAKMDLEHAKRMEVVGLVRGANPKEWFGSFVPIKRENWIKAEIYRDGKWIDYEIFE